MKMFVVKNTYRKKSVSLLKVPIVYVTGNVQVSFYHICLYNIFSLLRIGIGTFCTDSYTVTEQH